MKPIRMMSVPALLLLFAAGGCDDGERTVEEETEIVTQPTTETVEVERVSEDTFLVETRTEVSVDTTRIEGDELDEEVEAEESEEETPTTN